MTSSGRGIVSEQQIPEYEDEVQSAMAVGKALTDRADEATRQDEQRETQPARYRDETGIFRELIQDEETGETRLGPPMRYRVLV